MNKRQFFRACFGMLAGAVGLARCPTERTVDTAGVDSCPGESRSGFFLLVNDGFAVDGHGNKWAKKKLKRVTMAEFLEVDAQFKHRRDAIRIAANALN